MNFRTTPSASIPLLVLALAACGSEASPEGSGGSTADGGNGGSTATGGAGGEGGGVTRPQGLAIQDVTLSQSVDRALVAAGAAAQGGVPLVDGRDALLRVHAPAGDHAGESAEIAFVLDGEALSAEGSLVAEPRMDDLDSTLNVMVPKERLTLGAHAWHIEILSDGETLARYPESGEESFEVAETATPIELVFVPIDYTPTGSLAAISQDNLQATADAVYARFPVADVAVSVGAPMTYDQAIVPGAIDDWMAFVGAVQQHRSAQGASPNQFYIGLLHPGVEPTEWCGGPCFIGASPDVSPSYDPGSHVVVSLAYDEHPEVIEVNTLSGMGEALDLWRTSCEFTDSWGYDLLTGQLVPADSTAEIMSSGNCPIPMLWSSAASYSHFVSQLAMVEVSP